MYQLWGDVLSVQGVCYYNKNWKGGSMSVIGYLDF